MSTYFLLDPFEFPYYFYCILGELIYVLSIVACIPSTFCPTRDTCNYGQYINQFPQNTIKVIREFERIQKKICRHKMSIMFNEICINEEMLPKYTHTHIYIYIYIYIYRPFYANRMRNQIYLYREFNMFEFSFLSPELVLIPRLKGSACSSRIPGE